MSERTIQITELDRKRLITLIVDAQSGEYRNSVYLENLRGELERAEVVPHEKIARDVITMNSTVTLIDQDTGEEETYTLVYPEDADTS
jgi:regulator of nucleoside diphosphate kinase